MRTTEITDQPYAGLLDVPPAADGKPGIITDEANYGRADGEIAFTAPHLAVIGKTGSGKALALSTPIPTPEGFVRMGDIVTGQTVFGRDGKPCTVTDVWDVIDRPELYRLTLSDGQQLLADADHQWVVSGFGDRHYCHSDKRAAAITAWERAQELIADLRAAADHVESGVTALADLPALLDGLVPGWAEFFTSESGLRTALDQIEAPYTIGQRQYTRTYDAMEFQQEQVTAHFPKNWALAALAANRPAGRRGESMRLLNTRCDAALQLLADNPDDELVPVGQIVTELIGHGAEFRRSSDRDAHVHARNSLVSQLKRLGVPRENRVAEVTVRRASPSSQIVYGRPGKRYENDIALKALASRLEQRYQRRPSDEVGEQVITTAEMISAGIRRAGGHANWAIHLPGALELPDAKLPLDPYVLGAWLGDGSLHRSDFTQSTKPSHPDGRSDMDCLRAELLSSGYESSVPNDSYATHVSKRTLLRDLDTAGVAHYKHVPIAYLRASRAQRLALLQGLMDTDGTINANGGCTVGFSDRRLAEDTLALIRSLGIKANITWNRRTGYVHNGEKRTGKLHHTISFTTTEEVFRLPRKRDRLPAELRETHTWNYVLDIERIDAGHPDYEPARCIAVDTDDATFLAGPGFIPTHNSRTVLAPNCVRWGPRALVVMSSKGDLSELTIRRRAQFGTQYVMDLSGEIRGGQIEGVPLTPVRIDPCAWIETDDEAMEMASLLMQIGDVGAGGDGQGSGDSAFWKTLARRRLACLLRAGGFYRDPDTQQMVWGGGIAWALEASENVGPDAAEGAEGNGRGLTQEGLDDAVEPAGDEPLDMTTPNWTVAYTRAFSVGSRHAGSLMAARAMDERQRDSIGINMQVAMGSWAMESTAAPGAKTFNPSMLASGGTLHIVAGMDGAAPTVVCTVLIEIVRYWRKRVGKLQPVMLVLDEFVNGAQIPARYTNRWVSEGRGLGIRLVLGLQSTKSLTRLWGQAAADEFRAIMPAALILPGAGETQMLRDAAETTPPEERVVTTLDAGGRASQSRQLVQPTHAELLPPPRSRTDPRISYGRLLLGGMAGVRVRLLDITGTDLA